MSLPLRLQSDFLIMITNVLLHVLAVYECQVTVHVTDQNETGSGKILNDFPLVVQTMNVDMSLEMINFGRAFIVSTSERALVEMPLKQRRKRPVKILLGGIFTRGHEKPNYEPAIVEMPPLISLKQASIISSMYFNRCHKMS